MWHFFHKTYISSIPDDSRCLAQSSNTLGMAPGLNSPRYKYNVSLLEPQTTGTVASYGVRYSRPPPYRPRSFFSSRVGAYDVRRSHVLARDWDLRIWWRDDHWYHFDVTVGCCCSLFSSTRLQSSDHPTYFIIHLPAASSRHYIPYFCLAPF